MDYSIISNRALGQTALGITPFDMKVMTRQLEDKGIHVVHLEIGEPDFDTPENIKQAGIKAIQDGHTHYAPAQGLPELRAAVADYIHSTRQIPVTPEEVVIMPGAKNVIFYTMMALLNPGDEVIVPEPGYYPYDSNAKLFGGVPVALPLLESHDFAFDREEFAKRVSKRTRLIVLGSPHNPTGSMLSVQDLEFIAQIALKNNIFVIADEIYSQIVYEQPFSSIIALPEMKERTILLEGFSKTYAMTGWRLGYSITNKKLAKIFSKLMLASNSCVATFVQIAGIEALRGPQDEVERMRQEYQKRRDLIVEGLNKIPGLSCRKPQGAFYAFPNITAFGKSADEMTRHLLYEARVAVVPGSLFGTLGEGYIRISYANSQENLSEALQRIKATLAQLPANQ